MSLSSSKGLRLMYSFSAPPSFLLQLAYSRSALLRCFPCKIFLSVLSIRCLEQMWKLENIFQNVTSNLCHCPLVLPDGCFPLEGWEDLVKFLRHEVSATMERGFPVSLVCPVCTYEPRYLKRQKIQVSEYGLKLWDIKDIVPLVQAAHPCQERSLDKSLSK